MAGFEEVGSVLQQRLLREERARLRRAMRIVCELQDALNDYFREGSWREGEPPETTEARDTARARMSKPCWDAYRLREEMGTPAEEQLEVCMW